MSRPRLASKRIERLVKTALFAAAALSCALAAAPAHSMSFTSHGYYRLRVVANDNLDLQKPDSSLPYDNNRFGFIQYNQMRLRVDPTLNLNDWLSLHSTIDVLDNVLFGTQETRQLGVVAPVVGEQTLPPGAGSFYMVGPNRIGENGALNVRRVWMDVLTPIGKFRAGRQPSHWGLGIFQNDGNDIQGDFGDTSDRIMWLMQYGFARGGAITAGLLWDIAYEAQFDPRITGLAVAPPPNNRGTQQYAAVFIYDQPEFSVGFFGGLRRRNGPDGATTMTVKDALGNDVEAGIDGDTMLFFADLYGRYSWRNYNFKLEGVFVGGNLTTGLALDAIPFAGLGAGEGIIQLPPKQSMRVFMAAFEADAEYNFGGSWRFQAGYAQGDSTPLSQRVTQMGFRPDYQIALMMFNMPLGTSPSLYGQKAGGTGGTEKLAGGQPITANYINNALYMTMGYKHKFEFQGSRWVDWVKVGGKFITAWAPARNTNINFSDLIPQPGDWPALRETADSMMKRWYGLEIDISAEAQLFNFLYTALEAGFLLPGRAYNIDVELFDPGSIVETIPYSKAKPAWMLRLTTFLRF